MEITKNIIKYNLDTDNKTAVVKYCIDDTFDVIIPEYIVYENEKYKVTSIGVDAFYGCIKLTAVIIPNSVTKIEKGAFFDCEKLESINIPDSVTEIGEDAFFNCESLQSIEIPNSVTKIGDSAFSYCKSLQNITIPTSFKSSMLKRIGLTSSMTC